MASLVALALLGACATAPASAPASSGGPSAPTVAAPSRIVGILSRAGHVDAPTRSEVERVLGGADITRQDGAGTALTYRLNTCALLLLFAADERNAMRLTQVNPGPRRTGDAAPSLDTCAAEIEARRS